MTGLSAREEANGLERHRAWHIITCEYPPRPGGVSDYTFLLASGLGARGDEVHVWCPASSGDAPSRPRVTVHPVMGNFSPNDLRKAGRLLNVFPRPRHLLVQWVPHGFGYRSLNVFFCLWLWCRAKIHADRVDLMVHEPFLPFLRGRYRQNAAAIVHRFMIFILLGIAHRVWLSTPSWEKMLRPFAWRRRQIFHWLPLPSNVPRTNDPAAIAAIRREYAPHGLLVGHFSAFHPAVSPMLRAIIPPLMHRAKNSSLLLIGGGSSAFRQDLIHQYPDLERRIHAVGHIDARDPQLAAYLGACDLLIQPYPDGVTSRRTTVMAALSHGRPTITTSGALTEPFWQSSGALMLAPAGEHDAFVDSAARTLENAPERLSLGEIAQRFYTREFDIEHIVDLLRAGDRP